MIQFKSCSIGALVLFSDHYLVSADRLEYKDDVGMSSNLVLLQDLNYATHAFFVAFSYFRECR